MVKIIEGKITSEGLKFGIIVSRFNEIITDKLLSGALDALKRTGASIEDIIVLKVPGSFEIPFFVKNLVDSGKIDAIICLGAIIKGETSHNQYLSAEVIKSISHLNLISKVPISMGIITADTLEQAIERAGSKKGNRGFEAAMSAIEMANLIKEMRSNKLLE